MPHIRHYKFITKMANANRDEKNDINHDLPRQTITFEVSGITQNNGTIF